MKPISILIALTVLCSTGFSQITVSDYVKAFKVDANNVPEPNVTFTSNCGDVALEISEKMASGGCIGNLIRTYTATDECGNKATAEQYLSLQDTQGPEIYGIPEDIYVDDAENVPDAPIVGAKDLGTETIKVITSEERKGDQIIRTYTATDKCGNKTVQSYSIYIGKAK